MAVNGIVPSVRRKSPCRAVFVHFAQSTRFTGVFHNGFSVSKSILFQSSISLPMPDFTLFATFHSDATITHGFFCPDFI
jgi:hypothetical protein